MNPETCCNSTSNGETDRRATGECVNEKIRDLQQWIEDQFPTGRARSECITILDHARCWAKEMM